MPIAQTLPVEILAAVFEYALIRDTLIAASSASLLRPLSHVCSQWYSAARAYSALWRDISTRVDSPAWVDAALARSRTTRDLQLDVLVDMASATAPVPSHVARVLAEAGRAQCLSLSGPALAAHLRYLPQGPLSCLMKLMLSTHGEPSLLPEDTETVFKCKMPRLKYLHTLSCVLPWVSTCWADLGKSLSSLSLGFIAPALRPSPRELHLFLSSLPALESLRLDHVLAIYPPAGSPSNSVVPEINLPRLEFLFINENSVLSIAAFLGAIIRDRSDCSLNVTYETRQHLPMTLLTHVTALAAAASLFLRLPAPTVPVSESSSTTLPHLPEKHNMKLCETSEHLLRLELRSATSNIALCSLLLITDATNLLHVLTPYSQLPSPPLMTTALPTDEDHNDWVAVLPLILSYARPMHMFEVDSLTFQHPRPWLWSFATVPTCVPTHVTAQGPAAFGLLAALALAPPIELPLLLPPEFDAALPTPADEKGTENEARLALHAMTQLTLRAVDFAQGFDVALASTLETRAASHGVADMECIYIECCAVTKTQVDALRLCPAIGHVDWDRVCTLDTTSKAI